MWHCQCMKLGRRFSPVKTSRKCWEPNQRAPSPKKTFRQFKYWLFLNVCLFCCCWWWCCCWCCYCYCCFAVLSSFMVSQMFSWFVTLCLMTFYVVGIWYLPWFCHPVFSHFFVPQINGSLNMYVLFFFGVHVYVCHNSSISVAPQIKCTLIGLPLLTWDLKHQFQTSRKMDL